MRRSYWLNGRGELIADGASLGDVEYKIHVTPPTGSSAGSARGEIWGDVLSLTEGFLAQSLVLKRGDNGSPVNIVIKSLGADGQAQILVSGDPGGPE